MLNRVGGIPTGKPSPTAGRPRAGWEKLWDRWPPSSQSVGHYVLDTIQYLVSFRGMSQILR